MEKMQSICVKSNLRCLYVYKIDKLKIQVMTTDNYTIRSMSRSEVDLAIAYAAAEGWNPGKYDAESFYLCDNNGFYWES